MTSMLNTADRVEVSDLHPSTTLRMLRINFTKLKRDIKPATKILLPELNSFYRLNTPYN